MIAESYSRQPGSVMSAGEDWGSADMPDDGTSVAEAAAPLKLDADGLSSLLVSVLPSAYGYALRLTRHRADAEDLVQEAALRAVRAVSTFMPGTNFKAWFFRILTRCFWSDGRMRKRRPSTVELDDTPDLYLYAR